MAKYYQPSGKFTSLSFIYFIIISLLIFPILALIYTYLVWYIPFVYINFFITAGFGFGVGLAINYFAVNLGKIRNTTIALVLGFIGGLIALYFSWVVWVDLVLNAGESYGGSRIGITASNIKFVQVLQLAMNPGALFEIIGEINKVGTWGIRSATVSGAFLSVFWVIEALIVLVLSILTPYTTAKMPFCEFDNKWFAEINLPAFNFIENTNEMISSLEGVDQKVFENLQLVKNVESDNHSLFTLYSSRKGENYLTIKNNLAKKNDKGEIDFDEDEFIEYISIGTELKNKLMDCDNFKAID